MPDLRNPSGVVTDGQVPRHSGIESGKPVGCSTLMDCLVLCYYSTTARYELVSRSLCATLWDASRFAYSTW